MKEVVYKGHGQIENYSINSALWGVVSHEQRHANFNKYISSIKNEQLKEDIKITIQYKNGRPVPVKAYTEVQTSKQNRKDEDFLKVLFLNFQISKTKKEISNTKDSKQQLDLYIKLKNYETELKNIKKGLFNVGNREYKKEHAEFLGIYDFEKYNIPPVILDNPFLSGYNVNETLKKDYLKDAANVPQPEKLFYDNDSYKDYIVNAFEDLYKKFLHLSTYIDNYNFQFYTSEPNDYFELTIPSNYNDGEQDIKVNIKSIAKSFIVYSKKFFDPYEPLGISGSFKLNGVEISVDSTDSVYDIVEKINWGEDTNHNGVLDYDLGEDVNNNQQLDGGTSDHGIYAYIENNRLFLKNMETGDKSIVIEDDDNILHDFQIVAENPYNDSYYFPNIYQQGTNAVVDINGKSITSVSNLIEYNGLLFNLKQVTNGEYTVKIKSDDDNVYNKIESFVNEYNKVINDLNDKLKNDNFTRSFVALKMKRELKKAIFSDVGNKDLISIGLNLEDDKNYITSLQLDNISDKKYNFSLHDLLYSIGITSNNDETISINEEKLKNSIKKDKDGVYNLFFSDNGVIFRLKQTLNKFTDPDNGMIVNEINQISSEKLSDIFKLYEKEKVYTQFYTEKLSNLNNLINLIK